MDNQPSIEAVVAATLKEMGYTAPTHRTILIQKGFFLGFKFRFDGGYAICLAGKNVIEVYDDDGKILKTASWEETDKKDAA